MMNFMNTFQQQELKTLLQTYTQQIALGLMEQDSSEVLAMLERHPEFFSDLRDEQTALRQETTDDATQQTKSDDQNEGTDLVSRYHQGASQHPLGTQDVIEEHELLAQLNTTLSKQEELADRIHQLIIQKRPTSISSNLWRKLVSWFHHLSWNDKETMYQSMREPFWKFWTPEHDAPQYFRNFLKDHNISTNEKALFRELSETVRQLKEIDHEVSSLYNIFWNTQTGWVRQQLTDQVQAKNFRNEKRQEKKNKFIADLRTLQETHPDSARDALMGFVALMNNLSNSAWKGWDVMIEFFQNRDSRLIPLEFQEAYQAIEAIGQGPYQSSLFVDAV